MAPLPFDDLQLSSLELDNLATKPTQRVHARHLNSFDTRSDSKSSWTPGGGAQDPASFNNAGFIALFAIIGAAMVIASLWFFFWAKNGGFHFRQGDWEDYKSTVLRRKGPDGKTLSNATKSTKLGGSTIAGTQHYKWAKQAARSVVGRDEKGRKGVLGKRGWAGTHSSTYSDDFTDSLATRTVGDMTEIQEEPDHSHHSRRYRDRDVQEYKREKPARVGGLNRVADGSHFDTDRSETMTESSSEQPILAHQRNQDRAKERAERRAREEAAKMERRWKKEAEEAAAALARENAHPPPPPAHTTRKSAVPSASSRPYAQKTRQASRSNLLKEPSHTSQDFSDVQSTTYTQSTSQRTGSYYEEYRPQAASIPQRQSSPTKGKGRQPRRQGGYRRGADSDLE